LLDLDTLITRPFIKIDGQRYDLVSPEELSVLASHCLGSRGRRIETLSQSDDEDDGADLEALITEVAREVLADTPNEVFAKLTGAHQMAIVDVFTGLLLRNKLGVAGAMATAMGENPIGAKRYPDFSDFSEVRPRGGWWKRLLRWCGLT
jgi:hypothetical protein